MSPTPATGMISHGAYIAYGVFMFVIITLGLSGNIATVIVLRQVEHRTKSVSWLMLNLAIAAILICVFGYPVSMTYNLKDYHSALKDPLRCGWLAFTNASTGIACILTLSLMSIIQYRGICKLTAPSVRLSVSKKKRLVVVLLGIWLSAILVSVPPVFGWNRFVPVQSGVSCHPDWASQDPKDKAYVWFLVTGGFFIPLLVICLFYGKTYSFMRRSSIGQIGDSASKRRLFLQKKLGRMITAAIIAFLLSWSPYCIVSLVSTFKGRHVISPSLSLVPEMMAKASVIYNPLVYCSINRSFRSTLVRLITRSLIRRPPISPTNDVELEMTSRATGKSCHSRYHRSKSESDLFAESEEQRKRAFTVQLVEG